MGEEWPHGKVIQFPEINPVAVAIGPLKVHWYGIMYLLAFWCEYLILKASAGWRGLVLDAEEVGDFLGYAILGVVLGGRLGYVLFYNPAQYLSNPFEILAVWHGGMSFHGGLLGTFVAGWLWCRRKGISYMQMCDAVVVGVPAGLGLGRLGNFINGELWGKPTDLPWGIVFPTGGPLPRHPSQLYELVLEGLLLLGVMLLVGRRRLPRGFLTGLFLTGYGASRMFVELFRNPDPQFITTTNPAGHVLGPFSMGQLLSLPMILLGLALMAWGFHRVQQGELPTGPIQEPGAAARADDVLIPEIEPPPVP